MSLIVGAITGLIMGFIVSICFNDEENKGDWIIKKTPSKSDLFVFLANNALLMFFSGLILMLDYSSEEGLQMNGITIVLSTVFTMEALAPILYFFRKISIKKYAAISCAPWVLLIASLPLIFIYNLFT